VHSLEKLRKEIDRINEKILKLLAKRTKIAIKIAEYKKVHDLSIYSPKREKEIIERVKALARRENLDEKMAEEVFKKIMEQTRRLEREK
jgi:chorismate mutase